MPGWLSHNGSSRVAIVRAAHFARFPALFYRLDDSPDRDLLSPGVVPYPRTDGTLQGGLELEDFGGQEPILPWLSTAGSPTDAPMRAPPTPSGALTLHGLIQNPTGGFTGRASTDNPTGALRHREWVGRGYHDC
jgi:hypothetical protein